VEQPNKTYMITDIPQSCYFAITPLFDNNAFNSHNAMVDIFNTNNKWKTTSGNISTEQYENNNGYIYAVNEDEKWVEEDSEFNLDLIFDNSNIKAGGGGSSPTPTPTDLPPTLYYGISENSTISSLSGMQSMGITEDEFSISYTNTNDEYQIIAYETGYNDITSIKSSDGSIELLETFNASTITEGGKTYKVFVSEYQVTFDLISYIIKF
jgi:hypothetical protein